MAGTSAGHGAEDQRPQSVTHDRASLLQYLALQDQVRWQGPALALTAQAFLLTVALAESTTAVARILGALLGGATSFSAIYLIGRKSHQIEKAKKLLNNEDFPIEDFIKAGFQAAKVWVGTLWLFIAADVLIAILAITHSGLLGVTR